MVRFSEELRADFQTKGAWCSCSWDAKTPTGCQIPKQDNNKPQMPPDLCSEALSALARTSSRSGVDGPSGCAIPWGGHVLYCVLRGLRSLLNPNSLCFWHFVMDCRALKHQQPFVFGSLLPLSAHPQWKASLFPQPLELASCVLLGARLRLLLTPNPSRIRGTDPRRLLSTSVLLSLCPGVRDARLLHAGQPSLGRALKQS